MKNTKHTFEFICLGVIAIFAFSFSYYCGKHGFFPLDQSIVFDGAWRIIQGQVPFRDFYIPIGPVTFSYQATLFIIFGVNFSAYLIGAAIMNSAGSLLTYFIVRFFEKHNIMIPITAAIISAVFFTPPMGTTYFDQTSMFFCMLSLALLLYARKFHREKSYLLFLSGAMWVLAFLSKQNFALLFLPVYALAPILICEFRKKDILHLLLGIITLSLLFTLWLLFFSDIKKFITYFFSIPIHEGLRRFSGKTEHMVHKFSYTMGVCNFIFTSVALLFIYDSFKRRDCFKKKSELILKYSAPALLLIFLIFYSYIMILTTRNNPANAWAFLGIITGLAFHLINKLYITRKSSTSPLESSNKEQSQKLGRVFSTLFLTIIAPLIIITGIISATKREVSDFDRTVPQEYKQFKAPPSIQPLLWAENCVAGGVGGRAVLLKYQNIRRLISYLQRRNLNFFIFTDFTMLYGILGRPSPQPLLWFHKGLTFPRKYDGQLDAEIVSSLIKNNVRIVVFEEVSWMNSFATLKSFPRLDRYLHKRFRKVGYIGFYAIYEIVGDDTNY